MLFTSASRICFRTVLLEKICCRVPKANCPTAPNLLKNYSSESSDDVATQSLQGFLKAQTKLNRLPDQSQDESTVTGNASKREKTFSELFHQSAAVRAGDVTRSYVVGKIIQKLNDDLYIDYGGKFNCVCKVPQADAEQMSRYKEGVKVIVRVLDEEMAARFMGYDKDMTLLEADAQLVRLHYDGAQIGQTVDAPTNKPSGRSSDIGLHSTDDSGSSEASLDSDVTGIISEIVASDPAAHH